MDIIIHGAAGHMGRMVAERAQAEGVSVAALVDPLSPAGGGENCFVSLSDVPAKADAVIDFSSHTATAGLLGWCVRTKTPAVIATTGHTEAETAMIRAAAKEIPIFHSANMSLGVAVLTELAKKAAAAFPAADIEIVELHHNRKLDVPSGTALMLGRAIQDVRPQAVLRIGRHENGRRRAEEIGVHSLRLGNEVGTHEIYISTENETLTLRHQAHSRALFADGALAAAAFLALREPGLYTMKDLAGGTE
ncbi:MAG: 4-hydroxy-tetrahydrodipicolinate reductase [Oscillospiraceae bacterium]|nr:4-hydroxy-tetrahydrodipicolinate reductase [Oscillospiraceae bacterium]